SPEAIEDLSSCSDGEMLQVLKALPRGLIDAAVGGHTHMGVAKRVNGTAVIQPFARSQYVAWASLEKDASGEVRSEIHGPVELCGEVVHAASGPSCRGNDLREHDLVHPAYFLGREVRPDPSTVELLIPEFDRVK